MTCSIVVLISISILIYYAKYYYAQEELSNAKSFIGLSPSESFEIVAKGNVFECAKNDFLSRCSHRFILFKISKTIANRLQKTYTYEKPDYNTTIFFPFFRIEQGYYYKQYFYSHDSSMMSAILQGNLIYYEDVPDNGPSLVDD